MFNEELSFRIDKRVIMSLLVSKSRTIIPGVIDKQISNIASTKFKFSFTSYLFLDNMAIKYGLVCNKNSL